MSNNQKNLLALGLVLVSGWLFLNIDETQKKQEKATNKALKSQKKLANAQRNRSVANMLKVATPLLTPVVNAAVDEFKAFRARQQYKVD